MTPRVPRCPPGWALAQEECLDRLGSMRPVIDALLEGRVDLDPDVLWQLVRLMYAVHAWSEIARDLAPAVQAA